MIVQREADFEGWVQPYLTREDDPAFWAVVFETLNRDFDLLYSLESSKDAIFLQVGACSHWLRPHQTRWTAAGGFAAPVGYQGNSLFGCGLPEFDWFIVLNR